MYHLHFSHSYAHKGSNSICNIQKFVQHYFEFIARLRLELQTAQETAKQMQMHKVNEFERKAANKNYIFRKEIEFVRYEAKTPFSLFPVPHCNRFAGMLSNMRNHSRSKAATKSLKNCSKKSISLRPFLLSSHISIMFRVTNNFLCSSL